MRSTRSLAPPIPAVPRSAGPGAWISLPQGGRATYPGLWSGLPSKVGAPRPRGEAEWWPSSATRQLPVFELAEPVKLRCIELVPRHLALVDLEIGDCRYPYGGDEEGEAITFCGHPRRVGSIYCTSHFHLTSGTASCSDHASGTVSLRLVAA